MAGDSNPGASPGDRTATPVDHSISSFKIDPKWLFDPKLAVPTESGLIPDHAPLFRMPELTFSHDPNRTDELHYDDNFYSRRNDFSNNSGLSSLYSNGHINLRSIVSSNQWDEFSDSASRYNLGLALNFGGTAVDMAGLPTNNFRYTLPYQSQFERYLRSDHPKVRFSVTYQFR